MKVFKQIVIVGLVTMVIGRANSTLGGDGCLTIQSVKCHTATGPAEVEIGGFIWHLSTTDAFVPSCVAGDDYRTSEPYQAWCAWLEHWYLNAWTYHDDPAGQYVTAVNCFDACSEDQPPIP